MFNFRNKNQPIDTSEDEENNRPVKKSNINERSIFGLTLNGKRKADAQTSRLCSAVVELIDANKKVNLENLAFQTGYTKDRVKRLILKMYKDIYPKDDEESNSGDLYN
jgi:hypothetical protein